MKQSYHISNTPKEDKFKVHVPQTPENVAHSF